MTGQPLLLRELHGYSMSCLVPQESCPGMKTRSTFDLLNDTRDDGLSFLSLCSSIKENVSSFKSLPMVSLINQAEREIVKSEI